jgi:hypothetical protein
VRNVNLIRVSYAFYIYKKMDVSEILFIKGKSKGLTILLPSMLSHNDFCTLFTALLGIFVSVHLCMRFIFYFYVDII